MQVEVIREVRFAVVMYGGVSLAIYINGVVQELMAMVRATAVDQSGERLRFDDLPPNEKIYRDLAFYLAGEESEVVDRPRKMVRFIVDVISGTSAGGINGIFLATGLAGGVKIDNLEKVWLDEGHFADLLNDKCSVQDPSLRISPQDPPRSLLNSERMYIKLLDALDGMAGGNPQFDTGQNALVDEIDLFVTTTDFWGIPTPIRLFDRLIHERRHRQHFHFRFHKYQELNDFQRKDLPFIAYAARCTSSFPLAFDPMTMEIANKVASQRGSENDPATTVDIDVKKTFLRPATVRDANGDERPVDWGRRQFVDGGYLDNKPFGHAIQALANKQSDVIVDRKLIYIEPKPEIDATDRVFRYDPPTVVKNTMAAVSSLPTYETISDDLQVVLNRNKLIARLDRLLLNARLDELALVESLSRSDIEVEIERQAQVLHKLREKKGYAGEGEFQLNWDKLELAEISRQKGQIAYPYYRLRVASVTDDLARSSTRRAGFDDQSDYFAGVRALVYYWRRNKYNRGEQEGADDNETPLQFLRDFDYEYRLRRMRLVLREADRLMQSDSDVESVFRKVEKANAAVKAALQGKEFGRGQLSLLSSRFSLVENEIFSAIRQPPSLSIRELAQNNPNQFQHAVRKVKSEINQVLLAYRTGLSMVEPNSKIALVGKNRELIETLNATTHYIAEAIKSRGLEELIGTGSNEFALEDLEAQLSHASQFVERKQLAPHLESIGSNLREIYNGNGDTALFAIAREGMKDVFRGGFGDSIVDSVRSYLSHFYHNFDAYDQITFPTTYETPIGEGSRVDVARISPLDATSIIDQSKPLDHNGQYPHKLAGDVFFSFGAFFERAWRENDIRWGRLDGAEQLLSIVLPKDEKARTSFRTKLHAKILGKEAAQSLTSNDIPEIDRTLGKCDVFSTLTRAFPIFSIILDKEEWSPLIQYGRKMFIFAIYLLVATPFLHRCLESAFRSPVLFILITFLMFLPAFLLAIGVGIAVGLASPWLAVAAAFLSMFCFWLGLRIVLRRKIYGVLTGTK